MVHQTAVEQRANGAANPKPITRNMADVAHDVMSLAELQAKLLAADCRDATRHAAIPSGALVIAAVLALSSVPTALMGIAWIFAEVVGLPNYAGFLISAAIALMLSAAIAAIAWMRLRRSLESFRRSQQEFNQNLHWIKLVLRHSGTRGRPRC